MFLYFKKKFTDCPENNINKEKIIRFKLKYNNFDNPRMIPKIERIIIPKQIIITLF
jgi:hypothetical protein